MKPPFVSIVMPCLNERRHVEACLAGVLSQDYPPERLEILVADGGSDDGTREVLDRIAASDARVILVENPDRLQAPGMNAAIRRARGDVIVRMDMHCDYRQDYVRRCVEVLARTGADNVGGAQRHRAASPFQRAMCAVLSSPLGVGGARYRSDQNEGEVDTVFLGAFRRKVFEEVGLYDSRAITNEDAELNQRIHATGGRVVLSREIVVHYFPRDSFRGVARQYFRYGRGRARTLLKLRAFLTLRPLFPAAMVAAGTLLLASSTLRGAAVPLFGAYVLMTGAEAVRVGHREGLLATITAWAIFPVLHVSHGVGFWTGLARYLARPDWGEPDRLPRREPGAQ